MTTKYCGCKPGTEDSGWHEQRSKGCRDAEIKQWEEMMERYHRAVAEHGGIDGYLEHLSVQRRTTT